MFSGAPTSAGRLGQQAADLLAQNGVHFSLNTVLTRANYPQLEDLRKIAAGYGAELRVSRFRPSGRGKFSRTDLSPDKEQLEAFALWLASNTRLKRSAAGEFGSVSARPSSVYPVMPVRILLKSWAIPPARVPMASIFWACRNWRAI